jgi:acyl-CoA synthetase (AMP-forming)/AMP-acid ligase II
VAAMLEDRITSLEVYAAAFFGGYPVIHVNDRLAAPEVAHILADSGARALFHTDGRSEVVAGADAVGGGVARHHRSGPAGGRERVRGAGQPGPFR